MAPAAAETARGVAEKVVADVLVIFAERQAEQGGAGDGGGGEVIAEANIEFATMARTSLGAPW